MTEPVFAVAVGVLFTAGTYMVLRRNILKTVLGLGLLTNGTTLLIFTAAGLTRGVAPLTPEGATRPPAGAADPLPQALILTAIVISFAVQAFLLALVHRTVTATGTSDPDEMQASSEHAEVPNP